MISCEETNLTFEGNHILIIHPSFPGFISHLRVCWCAERREATSAVAGDKLCCCGRWGWVVLFTCSWRGFQLPCGPQLYIVPSPYSPLLCQHSSWLAADSPHCAEEPEEHMVTSSRCTLTWKKSKPTYCFLDPFPSLPTALSKQDYSTFALPPSCIKGTIQT